MKQNKKDETHFETDPFQGQIKLLKMLQTVLFIKLLLVHYSTQSLTEVHSNCSEDVSLQCPVVSSQKFFSLMWYMLDENSQRKAIIRISDNKTKVYNLSRPVQFGQNYSLFLPSAKHEDSGLYECFIGGFIGQRNLNHIVKLIVTECVSQTHGTPVTDDQLNMTTSTEDVSLMWSLTGYAIMGLIKILLSLISIKVIKSVHTRSSKRQLKW
ncbi:uncharacterized protein LOC117511703 [Thalassophryne amazonica]|uniref:uncharacterized protein LOC117511703 n=1 Tax=Thalassophryne amazonica TaxID=390379 RepID=UPI0014715DB6|nr:uncharacterized protein LOC117511703 [Thalassophryne amazonica]